MSVFPLFSNSANEKESMMVGAPTEADMMMEVPPFIDFKDLDQVKRLATVKPTVLFFKASWCPSCVSAAKRFGEDSEELKDVNLVVVDFDKSGELKVKYGVTYQHTFVQVSSDGSSIVKWNGGATDKLLTSIEQKEM
jgi:thiol-disulfide isomerase/thioredoxin